MAKRTAGKKSTSGSPSTGEPEYLVVGKLRRPHGVKGELLMEIVTDFPDRLTEGRHVFIGEKHLPATIVGRRQHHQGLIVKFQEVDSPEAAAAFRNRSVSVHTSDRPRLPDGYYYHYELVGCSVVLEDGRLLGVLAEVLQTGANDVYVVRQENGHELLLPAIPSVILDIDLPKQRLRVRPLEGLLEDGS